MRILLVEDNRPLSEWLARTLQKDRYVVECAYDGADAHAHARLLSERYDLVILDLELPGLAGRDQRHPLARPGGQQPGASEPQEQAQPATQHEHQTVSEQAPNKLRTGGAAPVKARIVEHLQRPRGALTAD